jgi:hypothetical protein
MKFVYSDQQWNWVKFLYSNPQSTNINQQRTGYVYSGHQSSIVNEMGGGVDIFPFSGEKAWGQKETFVKYRQSQE